MGVAIPQIITEDRASGALVVDGSLRFDSGKSHYLSRTFSAGNRKTWTISLWTKKLVVTGASSKYIFTTLNDSGNSGTYLYFNNNNLLYWDRRSSTDGIILNTNAVMRDTSSWYHILLSVNYSASTSTDRAKIYINGVEQTYSATSYPSTSEDSYTNANTTHYIAAPTVYYDGSITQFYFIDGQALDASYFGYTDALTNTWRPKKLSSSVAFGTNGFYLPFDGSAPIGQDQSGRGNNWTPVNFGGSNTLEKATGALPILNTDGGGKVARVGVRTDSSASSLVLALPFVGGKDDVSNAVNSGSTTKTITNTSVTFTSSYSNLYGGSSSFNGTSSKLTTTATSDFLFGTGDFTVEGWFYLTTSRDYPFILEIGAHAGADGIAFMVNDRTYGTCLYSGGFYGHATVFSQLNKWNHIAWVRRSGVLYIYENGVLGVSAAFTNNLTNTTNNVIIGTTHSGASNYFFEGYIQDYRIYKGLAKYTQNFIPASTDPDILPDTPSGVSYTSNLTQITDGAVALDGSGDYLELPYSSDLDFTGQFTLEAFVYPNASTGDYSVFGSFLANATGNWGLAFDYSTYGTFTSFYYNGNTQVSNTGYVPIPRAWNHYAVTRDASNVIRVFLNGQLLPTTATYSGTLGVSAQSTFIGYRAGLNYLNGTISNVHFVKGTALYTSNFTPPTGPISSVANTKLLCCASNTSSNAVSVSPGSYSNDGTTWSSAGNFSGDVRSQSDTYGPPKMFNGIIGNENATNAVCFASYSSNSTCTWTSPVSFTGLSSLRIYAALSGSTGKLSVNGTDYSSQVTALGSGGSGWITISQSSLSTIVFGYTGGLGSATGIAAVEVNGTVLIDNFNGKAIARAGDAAATNFNPFTVNINTQRGKQSGWCTLNPLDIGGGTLSNGNLDHTYNSSNIRVKSTISIPTTGKWYAEFVASNAGGGNSLMGVATAASALTGSNWYLGNDAGSWGLQVGSGTMYTYHNGGFSSFGTANNGDVIAVAVDRAAGKIWWAVNNIWIAGGDPVSGTNARYTNIPSTDGLFFAISNASNSSIACNFGQKPFKFPPPAGFQPLALANTPRPTIVRPDQFVGVTTYTGTGAARSINTGFKPDFVWLKSRSSGSYSHNLYDTVRGATKILYSDSTSSENTDVNGLTAFNSDGFSLGSTAATNASSTTYVAWDWKAGGNSNTYNINDVGYATAAAAGLTAGTITPTGASVNTKSGFSIITYTGTGSAATISHGIGKAPSFIIVKSRSISPSDWKVYHSSLGATQRLNLDTTDAAASNSTVWNDTAPTSSVFSVGTNSDVGQSSATYVAYCWAEIPGFSKFGSYAGNSSSDGPMVITGFKPRWIMIKSSTSTYGWYIYDTVRDTYNISGKELLANEASAEVSDSDIDILSNGFKLRRSSLAFNSSSNTFIYAAFAETPTQNLYGAQSNAR